MEFQDGFGWMRFNLLKECPSNRRVDVLYDLHIACLSWLCVYYIQNQRPSHYLKLIKNFGQIP